MDPELRQIDRRIADTLEELRILRVHSAQLVEDIREDTRVRHEEWLQDSQAWRDELRALRQTSDGLREASDVQIAELRALRQTSDLQTEELRRVSATNQIQTDALRVILERIHEDDRGHG